VDHAELQAENTQLQQRVIDINAQITDKETEIRRLRNELI
jgi:cell division protein FtsB